jgi:hypothetical protein
MKNLLIRASVGIFYALAIIPAAQGAVGLTVSPASITNDYVGKVSLTITGLSVGKTIRVERYSDINGNGVVDATMDNVFHTFTVTDGRLPIIGGVRNLNVPGDDDGVTNGTIRVDLDSPGIDNVFGSAAGSFIYRVSDPANGFAAVTKPFTVAQKVYSQGVRGRITAASGGAALPGTFVILLTGNGHAVGGGFADANGHYSLNTLPGSYVVIPLHSGYIADQTLASATVVTNQFTTNNQALATGPFTISGRLTDATNGAPIAGVFMLGQSTNNLFSAGATDTNGNYSFAATSSEWKIEMDESGLAQLGYLRADKFNTNVTSASISNLNFSVPKANALIYGTVKDNLNNVVNGIGTSASDQSNIYDSPGVSVAPNGNYTIGVLAGSWWVNAQSDSLPAGYTAGQGVNVFVGAGQAAQANLILSGVTAHLLGKVVDTNGTPQSGFSIQADPANGGNGPQVSTASDGTFDLGVHGGSWNVQMNNGDGNPGNLIGPSLGFNVTDGINISNINYIVLSTTAQITGTVTNTAGSQLGNQDVYAYATINGTNYNQSVNTDGSGHFSMGVVNGTWQVSLECNRLNSLGYSCPTNQQVVVSGGNQVVNFSVQSPTTHLLGKVVNDSGTPQPGLLIEAFPSGGGNGPQVATAVDGSFDLGVSAGSWAIQLNGGSAAANNVISPNLAFNVTDGINVSNINFVVLSVTAHITGIVTNTVGTPLDNLGVYANATINGTNYGQNLNTDGSGHFSIPVANGTWNVGVDCNGLNSRGYTCVNDQQVVISGGNQIVNFTVQSPTTHLLGRVVNDSGTPQPGVMIQAFPSGGGGGGPEVATAGDGSFDLNVSGGSWTLQLESGSAAAHNLISPSLALNVTDGVNISNINFVVLSATAQISGVVTNTLGDPLANLNVHAFAMVNGTNYNQNANTDGGGHYAMNVVNGTWNVGLDCNDVNSRGMGCVSNQQVVVSGASQSANFAPTVVAYTITTSSSPGIGGTSGGAGTFAAGSSRTVTATPNTGYIFINWTENGNVVSSSASYNFTLTTNRTLVANFTVMTYTIAVSASPSAGGTVGGGGTFASGSSPTVTATPNSGYAFANWTENGNVVSSSTNYNFTLTTNRTLVANFTVINYTIAVSASPIAGGMVGGGGTFASGASRTVTATTNSGYTFVNWTENGNVVSSSASYNFTLTTNRTLVANFAVITFTITLSASPSEGGTVSGDGIFAIGTSRTVTAITNAGYTFANWTSNSIVVSTSTSYTFTLNSDRNLVANFLPIKGSYNGLLYDTNGISQATCGFFTIMTTGKGGFTGKLQVGAAKYVVLGPINAGGAGQASIARKNLSTLTLDLQIDLADPDRITGTLSDTGTPIAELTGDRAVFDKISNPAPQAGKYTWIIPGDNNSAINPGGDSFGTISVDTGGKAKVAMSLADGTKVNQLVPVSRNGQLPFFGALYGGTGSILSWITFSNAPAEDLSGEVSWIKPPMATAKYYPAGFTLGMTASGSRYTNSAPGTNILNMTDGMLVLSGGNLPQSITNLISLLINNKVTNSSINKLTLTFTPTTGLFKGTVVNPAALTSKPISFSGVALQKQNVACGFSLGTNQTARVFVEPLP